MKCIRQILIGIVMALSPWVMMAQTERVNFDGEWWFAFGDASSPENDFGCGTEYFTYLSKAASIHNEGPYSPKFEPEKWGKEWKKVQLPHDWVVDLPFDSLASHSHGYKKVGFRYPETSVGWYRKQFHIPLADSGRQISITFDGIYRDAKVWLNGFYLGGEESGYAGQTYDITDYINYGGDNLVTVRVDATLEEGWFYEGAGIYRHVWLQKRPLVHLATDEDVFIKSLPAYPYKEVELDISSLIVNDSQTPASFTIRHHVLDCEGKEVASVAGGNERLLPREKKRVENVVKIENPVLWDIDNPYLYTVRTEVESDYGNDETMTKTGIREIIFDADKGFFLNGKPVKIKGVNMHQDHAGVGTAIPDALTVWRLKRLKEYGVNAYRSSHNPVSPEVLSACDSLGILVLDENRLLGNNDYHRNLLESMIRKDRNHPCVIAYSVGNEEWGVEWNEFGERLVAAMRDYAHLADSTRPVTVATSSGPRPVIPADIAGYNYILQNPVEQHRRDYPERVAWGTEETSGCGTRGVYFDDSALPGRMAAINRGVQGPDSLYNCIERGWKFYAERPWLCGLFYWTGFDYRGEPNPLAYPATGSQFGIFDYCGFPKDEAFYLKAWWTEEPVLHIFPHWNLSGHEEEKISIWAYSNCDEIELVVNGKNLGRKEMPRNGHLEWEAIYQPGYLKATGYKNGKKVMEKRVETTGAATGIRVSANREAIAADGMDVAVVTVEVVDVKGRIVPDACVPLNISIEGSGRILGAGNGDASFNGKERPDDPSHAVFSIPSFNGLAQILVQSNGDAGPCILTVSSEGIGTASLLFANH